MLPVARKRSSDDAVLRMARALWSAHREARFPDDLRGKELAGVDLVLLDAHVAGCIDTWLSNRGSLDRRRHKLLQEMLGQLDCVLLALTDDYQVSYYERLRKLASLASQTHR
jgi:hypothetical protein